MPCHNKLCKLKLFYRYWLPETSKMVTVGALGYTAITDGLKNELSSEKMLARFKATTKRSITELLKESIIVFPCKV